MGGTLALAVTAGMVAAVNPCGFALLPAYLSILVVPDVSAATAVRRALLSTLAMTVGFVAVFGLCGVLISQAGVVLQPVLPWFTMLLGLALLGLGVAMLLGRSAGLPLPARWRPAVTGSPWSMLLFGAAYALASLGCTIGPFLAIVLSGVHRSASETVGTFVAYAGGMGLVVGVTAVAVVLVRGELVARLRRLSRWVPRVAGALLALAGAYVAYYGLYELRLAADPAGVLGDPLIGAAGSVQQWLSDAVIRAGGVVLVLTLVALLLVGRQRLRARQAR